MDVQAIRTVHFGVAVNRGNQARNQSWRSVAPDPVKEVFPLWFVIVFQQLIN
jgi:hypothetical protein